MCCSGWQVDPKAEMLYSYSPYVSNINNPILYSDPDGDLPVLVFVAAAIIGGGQNIYSNWDKIVANPLSAIGYGLTGAAGGAVSVVNPALGRGIAAGGNLITDAATGNLPDFSSFGEVAGYAVGTTLDAIAVGGSGSLAKLGNKGLQALGKEAARELAGAGAEALLTDASANLIFERGMDLAGGGFELLEVSGSLTISAQAPNHIARGLASLSANATSGLGIQNSWNINGPQTTAKWAGNKGGYYEFGKDQTVWTKDLDNHGGGSQYKVYNKSPKGLEFKTHADHRGNYINRHKGPKDRFISWKKLKKIF